MSAILINIDVPDLTQATQFYTSAFDLRVGRRIGDNTIELLGLPSPIYLLERKEASLPFSQARSQRSYERHWTPVHFDIVVDSIKSAVEKVEAAGGIRESEIQSARWGKLALFSDPFGNGFCLIEFVGRGYDEIAQTP